MYAHYYEMACDTPPHGPAYLPHVLTTLKQEHPDHFRKALCVSPKTFNTIVNRIKHDLILTNNSTCAQISIKTQLAIALYWFGHDGNAASMQNIANWAGVSKGTIHIITH
jgi:UDP-N-acetylmuramate-alanine ligase